MSDKEKEVDEVSFKVADRRKFNPDGSVKEGVSLDPEPRKERPPAADQPGVHEAPVGRAQGQARSPSDGADDEVPGADDPASFVNFLSTIATNAAAALGAVPHPATGKRSLDLETGKYWLDVLAMFKDKTKGNLHTQEERLLEGLLGDLRMQYVHIVRATEEKLKAQAAAKFSGDEILGKK